MITKFENFTYGDLEKYAKSDLEEELSMYSGWYEFWEEEDDVVKSIVDDAIEEFKNKVPIFDTIHVQFVKKFDRDRKDIIGMYSHQSVLKTPIIFLSIKNIYNAMKEYDTSLDITIRTTIFHELGHAIVDVDNSFEFIKNENILQFNNEEKYVEDFAFELEMFGRISDPNILKLAKLFKEGMKSKNLEVID
ncbi:MAG: hypothetical protein RQ856_05110 [Candidatus Izemoplasmatales bacterium]|nr:hypothetical protein [Candidatus Izemoplasmatales bacterium]